MCIRDRFCYACNDDVIDPDLSAHMEIFGIDVKKQVKTEKTMAELELALNLAYSLSQKYEEGLKFTPMYGPCLTGIENVGNTCYIASIVQVLYSLPEFVERYYDSYKKHVAECASFAPDCFMCQMCKMAYGLCSGVYSQPKKHKKIIYEGQAEEEKDKDYYYQEGIKPQMFKTYFGKGNPDFSSSQQQDASLYLTYLLDKIQTKEKLLGSSDPSRIFRFEMETKLKCLGCGGVKYKKEGYCSLKLSFELPEGSVPENTIVKMTECLDGFIKGDVVELYCEKCGKNSTFSKSQSFVNFPKVLALIMQREIMEGMMLKKLPVLFEVPVEELDIQNYKTLAHAPDEVLLGGMLALSPIDDSAALDEPEVNPTMLNDLILAGVPELAARHALTNTGNSSSELAISWFFEHMSDPSLAQPLPKVKKAGSAKFTEGNVAKVMEFGFSRDQAVFGLSNTVRLFVSYRIMTVKEL
eukprot:TRINITY_DN966_c0_g1_i10.p1 TRINITY_DN966_c0_g1~~TRINITY_DN966_c0_g1_i10.p1  ORF type:complete len:467 (+),score=135.57 TRINITY_DN966_c0_g1_i10:85-1485(+)